MWRGSSPVTAMVCLDCLGSSDQAFEGGHLLVLIRGGFKLTAQLSFASLDFAGKKKRTKRDVFLAEMAAAVPWSVLEALIEPHYPKAGRNGGRRPFPVAVMLRIYCLQQ